MLRVICFGFLLLHSACCSAFVKRWVHDEARIVCRVRAREDHVRVLLELKNILDAADGRYTIEFLESGPVAPDTTPVWHGPNPYSDPLWPTPDDRFSGYYWQRAEDGVLAAAASLVGDPVVGGVAARPICFGERLSLRIVRDDERTYFAQIFRSVDGGQTWTYSGSARLGVGEQSSARALSRFVLLPTASLIDFALIPVYLVRNKWRHGGFVGPLFAGP